MHLCCNKKYYAYFCNHVALTLVMIRPLKLQLKSDAIGALASAICLVHCIATPFIFVSAASLHHSSSHGNSPLWWSMLDVVFLIISFLAVYWSGKTSSKTWMKYALYLTWSLLAVFMIMERLGSIHMAEFLVYFPAFGLIALHLYNTKYCQCKGDTCCVG